MSKFWNIFKREVAEKQAQPGRVSGGEYRQNIVQVRTKEKAMRIAAVYRAVSLISAGVAVLTLQYKRRDRVKDYYKLYETGEGAHINYLLSVRPNKRMNAYTFFKNLVAQVLLTGNAIVVPVKDVFGKVEELKLVRAGCAVYDELADKYLITDYMNGLNVTLASDEVIHIKNMCLDGGYWGMSTIQYAALTLGIAATADQETEKRFGTGGRFKAILQNNKSLQGWGEYEDNEMQALVDDIQARLNAGADIISVAGDGQLTPISMSSADMQFLDSRKFTIREIARFFGIPPSKLMDDTNANYKSTEMSNIQFYAEALQPIVTEIEREFNAKLVPESVYRDYRYVFDIRAIYALDLDSKSKWESTRLSNGQYSVNDLRRENDLEPIEGGDEVYLSVNFAPIGSAKLNGTDGGTASMTDVAPEKEGGEG
jgi:HK97 family phage portal protein